MASMNPVQDLADLCEKYKTRIKEVHSHMVQDDSMQEVHVEIEVIFNCDPA